MDFAHLVCHDSCEKGDYMRRRYWILAGFLVSAVLVAGSAVAATKLESPGDQSKAIINDAAGRLHVAPSALSSALKQARIDQIDSAVKAGRLTKQQGDALKAQIDKGQMPLVGGLAYGFGFRDHGFGGHGSGFEHPGGLFGAGSAAVTSYLGITQAQLRSALASGKSLAQIATANGKTAAGLVAAIVAATKSQLDKAVAAKHLTAAQEKAILARTQTFAKAMVNGKTPAFGHGPGFGHGFDDHGFDRGGMFGVGHPGVMFGAGSTAVTSYLGITQGQLRSALASGKSLAQIATANGKTSAGLVAAIVAATKGQLDKAVAAKHLTAAQEKAILARTQTFAKAMVNGTPHAWSPRMSHHGPGFGWFGSQHHSQTAQTGKDT